MTTYFITGTDTDCGKTYTTCHLVNFFRAQNKRVLAIKPVVSGVMAGEEGLYWQDIADLQNHNPSLQQDINLFKFKLPLSPHLAAKEENIAISLKEIIDFCQKDEFLEFEHLLVEGAGGLLVPLNEQETWLDLLKQSDFEVIIVVAMRLGCLNHALLTEAVLNANQIKVKGWIANCLDPNMLFLNENIETLVTKMISPMLGALSYQGKLKISSNANTLL